MNGERGDRDIWSARGGMTGGFRAPGWRVRDGRCGGLYWTSGAVDGITVAGSRLSNQFETLDFPANRRAR
jgi:hypothetical protein